MKDFIQDNGGMLSVLAVFAILGAGYLEWRIAVNVDAKFIAAGTVAPHRVEMIENDIDDLEAEDTKMYNKIERIVDILLED